MTDDIISFTISPVNTIRKETQQMNKPQTLSVEEAAEVLGIGITTAYSAVKRREIPSIRIGGRLLVPKPALEKLLRCETPVNPASKE